MPERTENARIKKLKDAVKFVNTIFERRACEYKGVTTRQALDHHRSFCTPVFDALRFVKNDKVGMQFEQFVHVKADEFVVDDLEEGRVVVKFAAFQQVAFDNGDG